MAVEADSEAQFSHRYWSFSATEGTVVIDDDELHLLDGEMAIWVSTHVTLVRSRFVTVHTTEGVQMDMAYPVSGGQKTSIGLYWGTVTIYVAGAAATYLEDVVFHADATGGTPEAKAVIIAEGVATTVVPPALPVQVAVYSGRVVLSGGVNRTVSPADFFFSYSSSEVVTVAVEADSEAQFSHRYWSFSATEGTVVIDDDELHLLDGEMAIWVSTHVTLVRSRFVTVHTTEGVQMDMAYPVSGGQKTSVGLYWGTVTIYVAGAAATYLEDVVFHADATGGTPEAKAVIIAEGVATTVVPPALPVQVAVYSGRVALSGGVNRVVSPADLFFSYSSSEAVTVAVEADSEAQFSHRYWSFSATEGTVVIDDDELHLLDGEMAIWVSTHVTLVRSRFVTVHTTEGMQMDMAYPVSGGQKTSVGLYWGTVTIYVAGATATYLEDVVFHTDATGGLPEAKAVIVAEGGPPVTVTATAPVSVPDVEVTASGTGNGVLSGGVVATVTAGGAAFEYSSSVVAAPITAIAEAGGSLRFVESRWTVAVQGDSTVVFGENSRQVVLLGGGAAVDRRGGITSFSSPFVTVHLLGTRVSMRYMAGGITYVKLLEGTVSINTRAPWGNYLSLSFGGTSRDLKAVIVPDGGGTPVTVVPPASPVQVAVYSGRVALSGGVNRTVSPTDFFFSYSSAEAVTVAVEADSEAQFSHPHWSFSATEGTIVIHRDEIELLDGEMAIWVSTGVTLVRSRFVTVHTTEGVQMDMAYPVSGGQKTSVGLYWGTVTIYVAGAVATYLEDVVFFGTAEGAAPQARAVVVPQGGTAETVLPPVQVSMRSAAYVSRSATFSGDDWAVCGGRGDGAVRLE